MCDQEKDTEAKTSVSNSKYEGITYAVNGDITEIIFCRPEKRNAITVQVRYFKYALFQTLNIS